MKDSELFGDEEKIFEIPKDPEKEKIKLAIEEITKIIEKYEKENEIKDEIINEIITYINNNNLDCMKILDKSGSTLAHYYCNEIKYFYLKIYLLAIEKILQDKNKLNEYLLIEDVCHNNIFEAASEIGDIQIFEILKKYLENNEQILSSLINQEKNNIFHISARENKVISLLFFYDFYNNDSSVLNHKNKANMTPLMTACYKGNYEYVKAIINLGADFTILTKENKNALFYAVESKSQSVTKYLILIGINKNQLDIKKRKAANYSNNEEIHKILDDKTLFELTFKCAIEYQSLKGHKTHIYYIILLSILILFQLLILILFNTSNKKDKCFQPFYLINFSYEALVIILTIITEIIGILFYFFSLYKNKKKNSYINSNIINNEEEKLYKLYSLNQNLCVKCKKVMSVGTQHCIACDKCIDNWDHHCFWLNVCIDNKNIKFFKLFMIQLLIIILMNFIMGFFFLVDLIRYPKIYYAFLSDCAEDQSFNYVSIIFLCLFIIYLVTDLYFLFSVLLPFLLEFLCSSPKTKNSTSSSEIKTSPLLNPNDDVV